MKYDGRGKLAVKHIGHGNDCGMLRKAASHVQGHCRQSPKLGDASNSGLDGDSLPARHNESLANISCPLHMSALLPDISDNNVPYPISL